MNAHRDIIANSVRRRQLAEVHEQVVADGYKPDSQRYFSEVENRMGIKKS
jgi:hypothetical protein